jgi:transcriptional regulator with XRE-family HTH domain
MKTLGERLRYARDLRRYGQRELAREVDLSPTAIGLIENDTNSPTIATVQALAEVLHVEPGWLAFGSGAAPVETEEDRQRTAPRRGRPRKGEA